MRDGRIRFRLAEHDDGDDGIRSDPQSPHQIGKNS